MWPICRCHAPQRLDSGRRSGPQQSAQVRPERTELPAHARHTDAVDDDAVELGRPAAALDEDTGRSHRGTENRSR